MQFFGAKTSGLELLCRLPISLHFLDPPLPRPALLLTIHREMSALRLRSKSQESEAQLNRRPDCKGYPQAEEDTQHLNDCVSEFRHGHAARKPSRRVAICHISNQLEPKLARV